MTDRRRNGFILLLVLGLVLASLVVIAGVPGAVKSKKTCSASTSRAGCSSSIRALPSPQTPTVTQDALQRAVDIMRNRVDQLGVAEPEIQTSGDNQITVGLPNVSDTGRAEREVGTTAQLAFYDWEANALTPNGKTVESQLQTQDPTAVAISQGGTNQSPGSPGAGSEPSTTRSRSPRSSRALFGQSEQLARDAAVLHVRGARERGLRRGGQGQRDRAVAGQHCLLSGPDDNRADLLSGAPRRRQRLRRRDPRGAARNGRAPGGHPRDFSKPTPISDPSAQFFVLKDNVALHGNDITNPRAEHRSDHERARRHVRVQQQGQERVPERHRHDRAPRRAASASGSSSTSISRSRSTTS